MKRTKRKGDPRSAAFYESQRGSVSAWAKDPVPAKVAPSGSVVISIRLAVGEIEAVRRAAAAYGVTVTNLVRGAILRSVYARPDFDVRSGQCVRAPITLVGGHQAMIGGYTIPPATAGAGSARLYPESLSAPPRPGSLLRNGASLLG
jgi:hypothetical protein